MLEKNNKRKTLISDFNTNEEKVRNLNMETVQEIRKSLNFYRERAYGTKFKIPLKVPKLIFFGGFIFSFYGMVYYKQCRHYFSFQKRDALCENKNFIPFLQMVEDLEYIRLHQRRKMVDQALFGKEEAEKMDKGQYADEEMVLEIPRYFIFNGGEPKNYDGYTKQAKNKMLAHSERFNI